MSLIHCKGCGEKISKNAKSCPKCGEPNKAKTSPLAMGCLGIIILGFVMAVAGGKAVSDKPRGDRATVTKATKPSKSKVLAISNITFAELDKIYSVSSKRTDLQKDEYWKQYKGKVIKWKGEVTSVSKGFLGNLSLQIKMKPSTFTSDLLISLKKDQTSKALKISKGETVSFTGTLNRWGAIMPITLTDGILNTPTQKKK